mmetsp:Transcript_77864/g.228287  ORF Transcript_77864/g.228287 Transcript_77864/m.228287 type:complete len:200 (+) Transcript_77864:269-868(+)
MNPALPAPSCGLVGGCVPAGTGEVSPAVPDTRPGPSSGFVGGGSPPRPGCTRIFGRGWCRICSSAWLCSGASSCEMSWQESVPRKRDTKLRLSSAGVNKREKKPESSEGFGPRSCVRSPGPSSCGPKSCVRTPGSPWASSCILLEAATRSAIGGCCMAAVDRGLLCSLPPIACSISTACITSGPATPMEVARWIASCSA